MTHMEIGKSKRNDRTMCWVLRNVHGNWSCTDESIYFFIFHFLNREEGRLKMDRMIYKPYIYVLEKLKEMGGENIMNTLVEKLKELLFVTVGRFIGWLDEAFPPETRRERLNHWIRLAARSPFIVFGLVLLVLLFCCCGRRTPEKMMKAPGSRNHQMRRRDFESNPRSYFRNLHAKGKRH